MRHGGFSFVELLVTISILTLMTGIIFAGYNRFTGTTLVDNYAHDIGLSIRLAQSYSLNVRGFGGDFETSYGIHLAAATPNSYILFADPNRAVGGFMYSGNDVETFTLSQGYTLSNVCATVAGGAPIRCFSDGGITFLDIVFDRPNPDAYFTSNVAETYQQAEITIRSPQGTTRTIRVLPTGYISVQ